jgi:hypothetical protein
MAGGLEVSKWVRNPFASQRRHGERPGVRARPLPLGKKFGKFGKGQ